MIKRLNSYFLLAGISMVLFGCTQNQPKKNILDTAPKVPVPMAPFRYHKMIEVSPGQDFDVMSWGRGSTTSGSLLILHSDSVNKKFTTTTGDLDGAIVDVFNADMDIDGNPELLIEAKAKDTVDYTSIYAYEFKENSVSKLDFPKLTTTQKKGYRGADNFYMKDGKLIREFPVYDGNTQGAKLTGQKRVLQYNLRSNNLTVKDLSADTLKANNSATTTKATAAPAKKNSGKKSRNQKEQHERKKINQAS